MMGTFSFPKASAVEGRPRVLPNAAIKILDLQLLLVCMI